MRKMLTLTAVVSLLSLSTTAFAHMPEGLTLGVWQWPSTHLPVMDGDTSEWDILPDNVWIDPFSEIDGVLLMQAVAGEEGREPDSADLNFRFAVGWNDELDRIYLTFDRFDDVWDRDDVDTGTDVGGGDDSFEVHIDADHGGEKMHFSGSDFEDDDERVRNNGRFVHASHYRFPKLSNWNWMWDSSATWHDVEPYSCCPDSYTLDGAHGTEATIKAEWWTVAWDDLDHQSPENSIQHDFQQGETIGMGIGVIDNDLGTEEGANSKSAAWRFGERCAALDGACLSDFRLLPVDEARLPTAVEGDSWGHIKASYMQ